MEDKLITQNPGSASTETAPNATDSQSLEIEKKTAELQNRDTPQDPEISQSQLSIGRRLLNWRTLIPLVIVFAALAYFAKQSNINPQQTWAALRSANVLLLLAAFLIYYLSFPIRTLRWRLLLQNVGYTRSNGVNLPK